MPSYLLRDTQTPAELLHWREQITPPLAGVSLFFCLIAQVLFYIFPRLRVFPRSLLSWINYYNIYYNIYAIVKWTPTSSWHAAWASHIKPGSVPCRLALLIDYSSLGGAAACNTLLCITLFLVIVVKVDIEREPKKYFWTYLAFAICYPFGISTQMGLAAAFGFGTSWTEGQSCVISSSVGNTLIRIPYLVFFGVQMLCLGATLFYIRQVFGSVRSTSTNQFPIKYLFVRFTVTFLAQAYNLFPAQFLITFPKIVNPHAILVRFCMASHASGSLLDAFVMIFGNVDFIDWAQREVAILRNKYRSWCRVPLEESGSETAETNDIITPPKRAQVAIGEEGDIPLEEMRLSTSDSLSSGPKSLSVVIKTSLEEQESSDVDHDTV